MGDRDQQDDLGIPREALDEWKALNPPEGFAERLVDQSAAQKSSLDEPVEHQRRWRLAIAAAAAAAGILIAVGFVALYSSGEVASGSLIADQRETVNIGERAVAVAEAGSEIRWELDVSGSGLVEQTKGKVFYRVERDGDVPFVVVTPEGEVRVLGTSFHVEVEPMRQVMTKGRAASAAIGAALAAAVVVTVYEGRVALATDNGEIEIGPGEVAWAHHDGQPSEPVDVAELGRSRAALHHSASQPGELDDDDLPAPVLRERLAAVRAQRDEQQGDLETLRARVRSLENAHDGPTTTQRLRKNAWYPPTPEDLEELVEQCGIRSDTPPVMGLEPGEAGDNADRMGLAAGEVPIVNNTIRRLHEQFLEQLRPLYLEATGDETGVRSLSADAMIAQINSAAMEGEVREAHRQLARELAGQAEPPATMGELTPATQALRLHHGLGDAFQRLLASELGEDRAHELRATNGGWPWGRSFSRTCHNR